MGFMDELRRLTRPYEDDDDFFEGADVSLKETSAPTESRPFLSDAQMEFESSFADERGTTEAQLQNQERVQAQQDAPSIFGSFGKKLGRTKSAPRERTVNFGGRDTQVILFAPRSFDEAGELVGYMMQNLTVVMTLESVPDDMSRRLLDFLSGIAFALSGKITPVSAKTYFITPQNVDILSARQDQPESAGHYL